MMHVKSRTNNTNKHLGQLNQTPLATPTTYIFSQNVIIKEEPAQVARAPVPDAFWTPPWGGVSGMSHWKETPGKT